MTAERTIATGTHGRYLLDLGAGSPPHIVVVGFHGYGENAAIQMERLKALRGHLPWTLVSIQALHRFYRRDGQTIAAGWMTREDRELMITDNVAYVDGVIDQVASELQEPCEVVFAGFSQGASMAYRAAALGRAAATGVIAIGGDLPPDLDSVCISRVRRVLIGWGSRDGFFTRELRERDERRLIENRVLVTTIELDAGHEWTEPFNRAAGEWLGALGV